MMMALNEGLLLHEVDGKQSVILWIRSVDYLLATPMLLLDLGLLAGAQADELVLIMVSDVVMIATGYWCAMGCSLRARASLARAPCAPRHPRRPHPPLPRAGPLWQPPPPPSGASSSSP